MGISQRRRKAIAEADQKARAGIDARWQTAKDIAVRLGWSHRAAVWALYRLKRQGVVEVREVKNDWRESNRTRYVQEYKQVAPGAGVIDNWALKIWAMACPGCGETGGHHDECPCK